MKTASKIFPSFSSVFDASTGNTYTSQYDIFTIGAGYLDIWAALNNTDLAALPATSPTAVYDAATNTVRIVNTTSASWGSSASWSSSVSWGSTAVWGASVWIDGASASWGSSAAWGSSSQLSPEPISIVIGGEN